MRRGGARRGITIQDYFTFLDNGGNQIGGASFFEEYMNTDYRVMSVRLNIPVNWQVVCHPGDHDCLSANGINALPDRVSRRINSMGFFQLSRSYGGGRGGTVHTANRVRSYNLRRHVAPITLNTYRTFILPFITTAGLQGFNNSVNGLNQRYLEQRALIGEQVDALRLTAGADNSRDADAFMRTLPADIANWFGF